MAYKFQSFVLSIYGVQHFKDTTDTFPRMTPETPQGVPSGALVRATTAVCPDGSDLRVRWYRLGDNQGDSVVLSDAEARIAEDVFRSMRCGPRK